MRCIMDDIFGYDKFLNEMVWHYNGRVNATKKYDEKHDVIIFYTNNSTVYFINASDNICHEN